MAGGCGTDVFLTRSGFWDAHHVGIGHDKHSTVTASRLKNGIVYNDQLNFRLLQ